MKKYWNFYDDFGMCVWTNTYCAGDTLLTIKQEWDDFMRDEEYNPGVADILLEDFNGHDKEMGYTTT